MNSEHTPAEPPADGDATREPLGDGEPVHDPAQEPPAEWRRLHPLSPLLRGGLALIIIAGIVIANLRDRLIELFFAGSMFGPDRIDVQLDDDPARSYSADPIDFLVEQGLVVVALLVVLGVIALIVFFSWLSWRFNTFRITDEAVEEKSGVLFRQHRRAPLERIQSVNLQRPLLARMLGLTQVDVQTAGQGGKVGLRYLGHRQAKEVREQILRRAHAAKDPGAPLRSGADGVHLDTGISDAGATASGGAGAVAVDFAGRAYADPANRIDERVRDLADFDIDPGAREAGTLVQVPVGRLIASILLGTEMMITAIILVGVVIVSITSGPAALLGLLPLLLVMAGILIGQFNRGFNFALSRAVEGVRIGAGLTATTTETIPLGRIHAVEARQPLGWRPFGWWKVRITTAGHSVAQGGQNRLQNIVLPVGREPDVLRVLEVLLPGLADEPAEVEALRDALSGAGAGYLGGGRRAGWVLWLGENRAGLRFDDRTLRIRRGWVTRSLGVMPIVRAQSVQLRRPLAHRFLGLASVQAHTVLGPIRMEMRGLDLDRAREVFDGLAATVVRVQRADTVERAAERRAAPLGGRADVPGTEPSGGTAAEIAPVRTAGPAGSADPGGAADPAGTTAPEGER